MKKPSVRKILQISLLIALAVILGALQIPITSFLALDFSYVILIFAIYIFSWKEALIIAIIFPWISLLFSTYPDPLGYFIIMLMGIFLIAFHEVFANLFKSIFSNKKYLLYSLIAFFNIIFVSFLMTYLNMIWFFPLYGIESDSQVIFGVILPFNLVKLFIVYLIFYLMLMPITKIIKENYAKNY